MLRRLLALLAVTIGLIVTVVPTSTTTASASAFTYDAPAVARVDVHEFGHTDARTAQVTSVWERSASPPMEAQGTVTTSSSLSNATNTLGALEDASSAAFRAADNVADFRVPLKHQPGAAGNWSRFGQGVDQQAAIREALMSDAATFRPNYVSGVLSDDSFRVVTDLGRPIGANGETAIRVVVGTDGTIWTAFPVKP